MFSFKINKKAGGVGSSVQVPKSVPQAAPQKAFIDEDDGDEEEPDFIDGLDGTEIVSKHQKKKKEEKKELVIPLITKNEWRIDQKREKDDEHREPRKEKAMLDKEVHKSSDKELKPPYRMEAPAPSKEDEEDVLKQQAIKELLEEASSGNISTDRKNESSSIPLLFQNKVPDGYEEDDNMDVSLRPDQATLEDYERIPIDEFGKAMLRGMGWKEEEGIGLRNKKVVDMAEPKIRPKGMGLGAEAAHTNKDVMQKNMSGNDNEKEDLTLKIGGFALINRGSKKGYYGQIESFDEDNNRVILRLAISGKMEAVSKFYIDVVSAKEYKKSSKVINSEKYEEYKSKQDNNEGSNHKSNKEERVKETGRSRSSSRSSDEKEYRSRSRRKEEEEYDDEDDYRSDRKRSRHRHDDKERSRKSSKKDKKDRHERKYDDRHRSSSHSHKDDDNYKSSIRNGDKRSDHHSKKDDYDRDRKHKHKHSSRSHRD